jgi:hypothetical protein
MRKDNLIDFNKDKIIIKFEMKEWGSKNVCVNIYRTTQYKLF